MRRGHYQFGDIKCLTSDEQLPSTFYKLQAISPVSACVNLLQMEDASLLLILLYCAQHPLP